MLSPAAQASARLPGPEMLRLVTLMTLASRPPLRAAPQPSASGNAVRETTAWLYLLRDPQWAADREIGELAPGSLRVGLGIQGRETPREIFQHEHPITLLALGAGNKFSTACVR